MSIKTISVLICNEKSLECHCVLRKEIKTKCMCKADAVSFVLLISVVPVQIKRTTLMDSHTSVTDVKFALKHMGLMLTPALQMACCASLRPLT